MNLDRCSDRLARWNAVAAVALCGLIASDLALGPEAERTPVLAGTLELQAGRHADALPHFERALVEVAAQPDHPQFVPAHLGAIRAAAWLDPARAERLYLDLVRTAPDRVGPSEVTEVVTALAEAGATDRARRILEGDPGRLGSNTTYRGLEARLQRGFGPYSVACCGPYFTSCFVDVGNCSPQRSSERTLQAIP